MALPVTNNIPDLGGVEITPTGAVRGAHNMLRNFRLKLIELRDASAAAPTLRRTYGELAEYIAGLRESLTVCRNVAGANAAAQVFYSNASLDWTAEVDARIGNLNTLQNWITTTFPVNNGFGLEWQFDANGRRVSGTFSVAQTASFRTQANTLLAGLT